MSDPVSTRCPKCKTVLKLKSSAAVGKKVPCPKCQHSFVVKLIAKKSKPAPAPDDDFLNGLGELEDDYGEAAQPPVPSRKRPSKKSSKKKKAQPSIWKNPGVIIGGSVVGVLLIVGVVLLASGVFSSDAPTAGEPTEVAETSEETSSQAKQSPTKGKNNKGKKGDKQRVAKKGPTQTAQRSGKQLNLAWLPDDSELIVSVRVADLWNSPLVQSLIENPDVQQSIAQFRESIGLEPADIESLTLGAAKISETAKSISPAVPGPEMMAGMASQFEDVPVTFVIRTSKPVDIQKVLSFIQQSDETIADSIQKSQYKGKEYHRMPAPNAEDSKFIALFAADEKTIVFGPEENVKTAIDGNGQDGDRSRFAFADAGQHFMIAFVPSDSAAFDENLTTGPFEDPSPASKKLAEALKGKLRGVAFGLTLNKGVSLQLDTNMQNSQAAQAVSIALRDIIQEGLDSLAESESPPLRISRNTSPLLPMFSRPQTRTRTTRLLNSILRFPSRH